MNANQLNEMNDFKSIDVSHLKEMVKQYQKAPGSTALGIRVQNNLQGLIWLACDKERQGLTIDVANLNLGIAIPLGFLFALSAVWSCPGLGIA